MAESTRKLSVLLWWPVPDWTSESGVGRQLDDLASGLLSLGVEVRVERGPAASLQGVDVVHASSLTSAQARQIRTAGIPYCESTVYIPVSGMAGFADRRARARHAARAAFVAARACFEGKLAEKSFDVGRPLADARVRYELADLLLPNSHGEADDVRALGVTTPSHVVPNVVDVERYRRAPTDPAPGDVVVCMARIEPRKNQLRLVEAAKGAPWQLQLVGRDHPGHTAYADAVRRAAGSNVEITGRISDEELRRRYVGASVHVLASSYETTGLSTLEAAVAGAAIVVSDCGHALEYVADKATVCDPRSVRSIRNAIDLTLATGPPAGLCEHVATHFSKEAGARRTLGAYLALLDDAPLHDRLDLIESPHDS